jgi:hypothetical protein
MITNVKAMVARVMTVGLLGGAFVLGAPAKAQAQVAIGVQIGGPQYDYNRRDYYERLRYEQAQAEYARQQAWAQQQAWARHEAWERHEREEAWERQQAYRRYSNGFVDRGRGWRDHDDYHDRDRDHDGR